MSHPYNAILIRGLCRTDSKLPLHRVNLKLRINILVILGYLTDALYAELDFFISKRNIRTASNIKQSTTAYLKATEVEVTFGNIDRHLGSISNRVRGLGINAVGSLVIFLF